MKKRKQHPELNQVNFMEMLIVLIATRHTGQWKVCHDYPTSIHGNYDLTPSKNTSTKCSLVYLLTTLAGNIFQMR